MPWTGILLLIGVVYVVVLIVRAVRDFIVWIAENRTAAREMEMFREKKKQKPNPPDKAD
jgi:hypothetical protein